ncbi:serine/threonine protein phosphatase [bacterium]|nr:serine/threonine protein phosphatase [bacterium]
MKKFYSWKNFIVFVFLLSQATPSCAGVWGDLWDWAKKRKGVVTLVGVVGIVGGAYASAKFYKYIKEQQKNREIELKKKREQEEKRGQEEKREQEEKRKKWIKEQIPNVLLPKEMKSQEQINLNVALHPTPEQFLKTLKDFVEKSEKMMNGKWLDNKAFDIKKEECFVQKVELEGDIDIKLFTDLHSDAGPLKQLMGKLQANGWIDKKEPFKLIKKNKYLVFLGDYIDRGTQGVDVLYIVMQLFINNPKNVILIRGNHEDECIYSGSGFLDELLVFEKINTKDFHREEVGVKEFHLVKNLLNESFNYMPSAIFFVHKNKYKRRCYFFTHGAPDVNFFPKAIIKSSEKIAYQPINKDQSKNFQWSDLAIDLEDFNYNAKSYRGAGREYGKGVFVEYAEKFQKECGIPIIGLVRGHQQSDFTDKFKKGHGFNFLYDSYHWNGKSNNAISLKFLTEQEPFIATLDYFRYEKYYGGKRDKATIFTIDLHEKFEDCKIVGEIMTTHKKVVKK